MNALREKYLKVMDGESRLLYILWVIDKCAERELILDFYLKQGLTGRNLFSFIQEKFKGSPQKTIAYASKNIENSNSAKPRILGLNFRNV
jgi:NMD protein affecting ribosome stability and mRNA decay